MKKIILLIAAILLMQTINAQNWCPPGATWHFKAWSGLLNIDASIEYKYIGDIVVGGQNCKHIMATFKGKDFYAFSGFDYQSISNYASHLTYENNSVLYLWNGSQFDTVVNYNAVPGDHWRPIVKCIGCGTISIGTVVDTGHVVNNNLSLKRIVLQFNQTDLYGGTLTTRSHTVEFTEKLSNGGSYSARSLFSFELFDFNTIYELPFYSLLCYTDDLPFIYNPNNVDCKNSVGISEESGINLFYNLYPNPNTGDFNLKLTNNATVLIRDNLGKLVYSGYLKAGDNKMDLTNLKPGVYFVQIENEPLNTRLKLVRQ